MNFVRASVIKQLLLAPGPTPVPARVRLAMAQPIFHHRTPQFSALFGEVRESLKRLFQTEQDVLILASSGTGAMEAAVNNCFAPGDEVVVVNGGKFGERWTQARHCVRSASRSRCASSGAGRCAPTQIAQALDEHPAARGVFVQASETSTTRRAPDRAARRGDASARRVAGRRRHHRRRRLRSADGPLGDRCAPHRLAEGAHAAARAWRSSRSASAPGAASRRRSQPRFYFDLTRERANQAKNTTA